MERLFLFILFSFTYGASRAEVKLIASQLTLGVDDTLTLNCSYNGNSTLKYFSWLFDGKTFELIKDCKSEIHDDLGLDLDYRFECPETDLNSLIIERNSVSLAGKEVSCARDVNHLSNTLVLYVQDEASTTQVGLINTSESVTAFTLDSANVSEMFNSTQSATSTLKYSRVPAVNTIITTNIPASSEGIINALSTESADQVGNTTSGPGVTVGTGQMDTTTESLNFENTEDISVTTEDAASTYTEKENTEVEKATVEYIDLSSTAYTNRSEVTTKSYASDHTTSDFYISSVDTTTEQLNSEHTEDVSATIGNAISTYTENVNLEVEKTTLDLSSAVVSDKSEVPSSSKITHDASDHTTISASYISYAVTTTEKLNFEHTEDVSATTGDALSTYTENVNLEVEKTTLDLSSAAVSNKSEVPSSSKITHDASDHTTTSASYISYAVTTTEKLNFEGTEDVSATTGDAISTYTENVNIEVEKTTLDLSSAVVSDKSEVPSSSKITHDASDHTTTSASYISYAVTTTEKLNFEHTEDVSATTGDALSTYTENVNLEVEKTTLDLSSAAVSNKSEVPSSSKITHDASDHTTTSASYISYAVTTTEKLNFEGTEDVSATTGDALSTYTENVNLEVGKTTLDLSSAVVSNKSEVPSSSKITHDASDHTTTSASYISSAVTTTEKLNFEGTEDVSATTEDAISTYTENRNTEVEKTTVEYTDMSSAVVTNRSEVPSSSKNTHYAFDNTTTSTLYITNETKKSDIATTFESEASKTATIEVTDIEIATTNIEETIFTGYISTSAFVSTSNVTDSLQNTTSPIGIVKTSEYTILSNTNSIKTSEHTTDRREIDATYEYTNLSTADTAVDETTMVTQDSQVISEYTTTEISVGKDISSTEETNTTSEFTTQFDLESHTKNTGNDIPGTKFTIPPSVDNNNPSTGMKNDTTKGENLIQSTTHIVTEGVTNAITTDVNTTLEDTTSIYSSFLSTKGTNNAGTETSIPRQEQSTPIEETRSHVSIAASLPTESTTHVPISISVDYPTTFSHATSFSTAAERTTSPADSAMLPCPADDDSRCTHWETTQPGTIVTIPCALSLRNPELSGNISRQCAETGTWLLPKYNCVRKDIEDIQNMLKDINGSLPASVINDVLQKLSEVTSLQQSGERVFSGEIEAITSTLATIVAFDNLTVSHNQSVAFLTTASNLLDSCNSGSWQSFDQNSAHSQDTFGASKLLDVISLYADVIAKSLPESETEKTIEVSNFLLQVRKINAHTTIVFPDSGTHKGFASTSSIHLKPASLKGSTLYSSVVYKNLSSIISTKATFNSYINLLGSAVISAKLDHWNNNSNFKITIVFQHSKVNNMTSVCSFRTEKSTLWEKEGCSSTFSNSTTTICECNHLTNFAILMSPWTAENVDTKAIRIISILGCSVSTLGLVVTIIAHFYFWRYIKSDRKKILLNLCFALVMSYAIFIGGVDRTENRDVCTTVAALLHYIYLVVFFLMLVEGIEIAYAVIYVFETKSRLKWLIPSAWLMPALIVTISLAITRARGYGNDRFCWLSFENGLIWAFVSPALVILLINSVLLGLVIRAIFRTKKVIQMHMKEKTITGIRSLCVLLPLVGCTWMIGIFYVNNSMAWIQYAFAICNAFQGLVIFVFHCALNTQITKAFRTVLQKYKRVNGLAETSTSKFRFIPKLSQQALSPNYYHISRSSSTGSEGSHYREKATQDFGTNKSDHIEIKRVRYFRGSYKEVSTQF